MVTYQIMRITLLVADNVGFDFENCPGIGNILPIYNTSKRLLYFQNFVSQFYNETSGLKY
jgi:hypothetical protein